MRRLRASLGEARPWTAFHQECQCLGTSFSKSEREGTDNPWRLYGQLSVATMMQISWMVTIIIDGRPPASSTLPSSRWWAMESEWQYPEVKKCKSRFRTDTSSDIKQKRESGGVSICRMISSQVDDGCLEEAERPCFRAASVPILKEHLMAPAIKIRFYG